MMENKPKKVLRALVSCLARGWAAKPLILLVAVFPGTLWATALGTLAQDMKPGQWLTLNQNGDGSGWTASLIKGGPASHILNYTDKGKWNSLNSKIYFIGKGVMTDGIQKFITYDDATNVWSLESKPYWDCTPGCYGHAYQHNSIDNEGNTYYHNFNSTSYYKLSYSTGTWSTLPAAPSEITCCIGVEYFPEMKGLLAVGAGRALFFSDTSKQWSQLVSGLAMGDYHNVALYNPKHKVIVYGGGNGSKNLYKVDAAGKISTLKPAPINIGIAATVFTYDPVSGRYLILGANRSFYEYDVGTDSWAPLSTTGIPIFPPSGEDFSFYGTVAVPVSTYGVIVFMSYNQNDPKVFVYKHATGVLDSTAPLAPQNLTVE